MKQQSNRQEEYSRGQARGQQGNARTILLSLVFFCLGLIVSAFLLRQPAKPSLPAQGAPTLSDATKSVLAGLNQPIEIRFYSLLDSGVPSSLQTFSVRAGQLLEACQQNSNGKIHLVRYDAQTNVNPNVAIADGIKGFDLDKGEGCYLGLALSSNGKKEVLSQLAPEGNLPSKRTFHAQFCDCLNRLVLENSQPQFPRSIRLFLMNSNKNSPTCLLFHFKRARARCAKSP